MKLFSLLYFGVVALAASTTSKKKKKVKEPTFFNGIQVPPMFEITPDNWEPTVEETELILVKHYSPYCHHCQDFAPIYQTLYEYYYTSKPLTDEVGNFTEFYKMRFASMNCIAYYDLCVDLKVASYPSTTLYKKGKPVETVKGVKNLQILTRAFEPYLEEAKPGSRPEVLNLPEPGDDETPPPPKPSENFNPEGVSIPLNASSYETLVVTPQKPWFIKFYAPWCHHCRAMRPNWEQLAKEMKGKLNIGEVNCDVESKLCREMGINSYPSLLFLKGHQRVEYEGLRGLGDFVEFAERAIEAAGDVPNVTAKSLKKLEAKEEVIFIYFYDHATTSEDFMALDQFPLNVMGRAKVVKTKDPALAEQYKITTFPRLLVSREGRPTYYNPITPEEMRDVDRILSWMKSVWLPIVPELTASNAREIMDGKIVVLGVLNREESRTFQHAMKEMKKAANDWMDKQIVLFQEERQSLRDAKKRRIEEAEARGDQRAVRQAKAIRINMDKSQRKEVAFAWVDGVFWQRWLRTTYGIDVTEGNRIIINDEDRRRYWDTTVTGSKILLSRPAILETLSKVVASPPEIQPKYTISSFQKLFFDLRMAFVDHPYRSTGMVVVLVLAAAVWFRRRIRRGRPAHFTRPEDGWSTKELMKEGFVLSGTSGNGKVD